MTNEYLKIIQDRFKKNFPHSHLIISQEISVHHSGDSEQWSLWILFDEFYEEDLQQEKVFETFSTFKELDSRLGWHMYRVNSCVKGIKEEVKKFNLN